MPQDVTTAPDAATLETRAAIRSIATPAGLDSAWADSQIDSGADVVVCSHPHVLQGMQVYNQRNILYSIGNFVFGGNATVRSLETVAARFTLTFGDDNQYLGQQMRFLAPVPVGHVLTLRAWVSRIGRSSLTVCVNGLAATLGSPQEAVLQGVFDMVAVDAKGRPTPIANAYLNPEETP